MNGKFKQRAQIAALADELFGPRPALALLSNIAHETGGSYDYLQKQFGGGPGRGLIQMEGKMLDAYNKYLKDTSKTDSAENQLEFISDILKSDERYDIGAGHRSKLEKKFETGSIEDITEAISERLLRPGKPHMEQRLDYIDKLKPLMKQIIIQKLQQ